jgi:hypothetical protein
LEKWVEREHILPPVKAALTDRTSEAALVTMGVDVPSEIVMSLISLVALRALVRSGIRCLQRLLRSYLAGHVSLFEWGEYGLRSTVGK